MWYYVIRFLQEFFISISGGKTGQFTWYLWLDLIQLIQDWRLAPSLPVVCKNPGRLAPAAAMRWSTTETRLSEVE